MATVIILSHTAQNPLTTNDHHTIATVITIDIIHPTAQQPILGLGLLVEVP
jgi:hypothetical protein